MSDLQDVAPPLPGTSLAVAIDDVWADLFQLILGAFDELGGSRYGPQWMVLAMVSQLWVEAPELMAWMWSILQEQQEMASTVWVSSIIGRLQEVRDGV